MIAFNIIINASLLIIISAVLTLYSSISKKLGFLWF